MKKLSAILLFAATLAMNAQDVSTGYAFMDNDGNNPGGIYTFEYTPQKGFYNFTEVYHLDFDRVSNAAVVDGKYYFYEFTPDMSQGYLSGGFYYYDLEEEILKQVANYNAAPKGPVISKLAYDYQTNTMWGLNHIAGTFQLASVNLETGVISPGATLKFDKEAAIAAQYENNNFANTMNSIAINYDGECFGVSYWGALYRVNLKTGFCRHIADLDYNPENAFMYQGNQMFFDHNTGELYMRWTHYNWDVYNYSSEIFRIDTTNGHCEIVTDLGDIYPLVGVDFDFIIAEASAPARVTDLNVTAGEKGALSANIEWNNPSKTYRRGAALQELSAVKLYRNGEVIATFDNPEIGAHMTYTDNSISERGDYAYKVVGENSMGQGDRSSVSVYLGLGDPNPVTDLNVVAEGETTKISWTAPMEGTGNSFINVDNLTYDLSRSLKTSAGSGEPVVIASGISATEFVDNTITEQALYCYSVTANADGYHSEATVSQPLLAGPGYQLPHTFEFLTLDEFNLWATFDYDGDYNSWTYSDGYYGTMRGARLSYNYSEYAPEEYMISPGVNFKGGVRYKVTMDVLPGTNNPEKVGITFGQGRQVTDLNLVGDVEVAGKTVQQARVNLPVVDADGCYNIGIRCVSEYKNFNVTVGNVCISEDHEGYIEGCVTCDGEPVAGALVAANGGQFVSYTDAEGKYKLNYLPEGDYSLFISALGYYNKEGNASVTKWETSPYDIALEALPQNTVTGKVIDVVGDPVVGAEVAITGYNSYSAVTDGEGRFSIGNIFQNSYYHIHISKNKLVAYDAALDVNADLDLGEITMADNIKSAGKITLEESQDGTTMNVSWSYPENDPKIMRYDDGTVANAIGYANPPANNAFGVIFREPAKITDVQFYLSSSQTTHYSVSLYIFSLNEDGDPTPNMLYANTYLPVTDDAWTSFTLPAPVEAPNGCYIAISSWNFIGIAIDGNGDKEKYPFEPGVNCFTDDFATGENYYYLDDQENPIMRGNFLLRAVGIPYSDPDDTKAKAPRFIWSQQENASVQPKLTAINVNNNDVEEPVLSQKIHKVVQERVRYNVYRLTQETIADPSAWTLVSSAQKETEYADTQWSTLAQGVYHYAVEALYTGGINASPTISDLVGNKMYTSVVINLTTDTQTNEAEGATIYIYDNLGQHAYDTVADAQGMATIENVWKTTYNVYISLPGFITTTDFVDLTGADSFTLSYTINEDKKQPSHLVIDRVSDTNDYKFIWNFPDVMFDDFEGHDDFAIDSPGQIGWTYYDVDNTEVGSLMGVEWENQWEPRAYMIFNPFTTTPAVYPDYGYVWYPFSGQKMLTSWAAYGVANDDWIVSPALYFDEDFVLQFHAQCFDYYTPETIEVLYSTTDNTPDCFTNLLTPEGGLKISNTWWNTFTYDLPSEVKYVAIRCISDQARILMIDNIQIGIPSKVDPYCTPARNDKPARAPMATGAYEVYLNDVKVADTNATSYIFENLSDGHYTAGVLASYTSGKTAMSTIDFYVGTTTGLNSVEIRNSYLLDGRRLTVTNLEVIGIYNLSGMAMPVRNINAISYDLGALPSGIYMLSLSDGNKVTSHKIVLK